MKTEDQKDASPSTPGYDVDYDTDDDFHSRGESQERHSEVLRKLEMFAKKYKIWMVVVVASAFTFAVLSHTTGAKPQSKPIPASATNFIDRSTFESASDSEDVIILGLDSKELNCNWKFDRYESSEYENVWRENIKNWQVGLCLRVGESEHLKASQDIIHEVQELMAVDPEVKWASIDSFKPGKLKKEYKYMSKFHYKRECFDDVTKSWSRKGLGVQLIEPLWGYLRDPFDVYCSNTFNKTTNWNGELGQSKEYIMPQGYAPYAYTLDDILTIPEDQWRTHGIPAWHSSFKSVTTKDAKTIYTSPKNLFLDLGSSYFRYWTQIGSVAASGLWFYNTYHERGQKFDRFIQVEVERLDPRQAYDQLPNDLVGKYTLINIPLEVGETKFDVSKLIKSYIKKNDFFVIKVDIDSAPIEEPFVYSLLKDDGVSEYIDELMFEHHVDVDIMRHCWGLNLPHDMADSYDLFYGLRARGIRAHSWP